MRLQHGQNLAFADLGRRQAMQEIHERNGIESADVCWKGFEDVVLDAIDIGTLEARLGLLETIGVEVAERDGGVRREVRVL